MRSKNSDLFYYQQLNSPAHSWELSRTVSKTEIVNGSPRESNTPLSIRGILTESEFGFQVRNQFGSGGLLGESLLGKAGDAFAQVNKVSHLVRFGEKLAEGLFEGSRGRAALVNAASEAVKTVENKISEWSDNMIRTAPHSLGDFVKSLGDSGGFTRAAQSKFISGMEKIPVFGGTEVGVPFPDLKTVIFHQDGSNNVKDTVKNILEVVMGDTYHLSGVLGLQEPPGGYEPDLRQIGAQEGGDLVGTWTLRIGSKYTFRNLLITDFNFEFSTIKGRNLQGECDDPFLATLKFEVLHAGILTKHDLKSLIDRW